MSANFQLKRTPLPKNGFWGRNFKNLSLDSKSASLRYYVHQFSGKMNNFEFLGPTLPKNGFWGRKFKNLSLDSESTNLQIHWKTPVPGSFFTKKDSGTGVFLYEISKNTFSYIKLPVAASKYRPYAVNFMLLLIFSKTSRQSRRNATILPWVFNILDSWPQWIYLSIALIHQDIDGVIRPMWRGYFELDVAISTFYRNCNYNIHDILRVKVTIQCWSEH